MMFPEQILAAKLENAQIELKCLAAIEWIEKYTLIPSNMYGSKRSKWMTYNVRDMTIDRMIRKNPIQSNAISLRDIIEYNQIEFTHIEITHYNFLISYSKSYDRLWGMSWSGKKTEILPDISWVGNIETFLDEVTLLKLIYSE